MKLEPTDKSFHDHDPNAEGRKQDHIQLAFQSQVGQGQLDDRFYYEPLLAEHPAEGSWPEFTFLGKIMKVPIWVSSMTGGTAKAKLINQNLARACQEFGIGMGLGSCRALLDNDDRLADFDIRDIIGDEQLLFANLGIAQLEQLLEQQATGKIKRMLEKLRADGLIIHVNPFQEWLQPEGDRFIHPPITTIKRIIDALPNTSIIVKEVGQGMGIKSLQALLQLPIAAIDFAANGGTNFAKLELLRSQPQKQLVYAPLANVGHSASEMVDIANQLVLDLGDQALCKHFIISGGVQTFLDGYHLVQKSTQSSIYGQAAAFLRYAQEDYESLQSFTAAQVRGLELARAFLHIK